MTPVQFEDILQKVKPFLEKRDTNFRKSISAAEKLQVALRYLATGETQTSLQIPFRIQQSTISRILKETIPVIYNVLNEDVLKFPEQESDWLKIADNFFNMWGFPNCIGAIDGKHCKIKPLKDFGSNYWCYKNTHSFVLMAIVDANYKFIYADVGVNGRIGDAGIWLRSDLKHAIEQNRVNIPSARNLPHTSNVSPFAFVGDDAFPLSKYIMKPFSQTSLSTSERRFNYMLSRSRRVVENAFGILANRFSVLFTPIFREPEEAIKIVLACICLHNYLRESAMHEHFLSREEIEETNQFRYDSIDFSSSENPDNTAREIREQLREYFDVFNSNICIN